MRQLIGVVLLCGLGASGAFAAEGLVVVQSAHGVEKTMARLEAQLREQGMQIFNRINHAAAAEQVGETLRPTELILFGNPKVGTPLMQCAQSIGIDLPLKALVWEDASGQVWLAYHDPVALTKRHHISTCATMLPKIQQALKRISTAATQP